MFRNKTVFLLGAGASWHYGYPTGEELVRNVADMSERFHHYCQMRLDPRIGGPIPDYARELAAALPAKSAPEWIAIRDAARVLATRLRTVKPLLIDFFLGWNPPLRDIGRMMIAAVIFECEEFALREGANPNRRKVLRDSPTPPDGSEIKRLNISRFNDDWIRFVTHKLVSGCSESADLLSNDVRFITFNYDGSLEHHLYNSLHSIDLLHEDEIRQFLSDDRIMHVYGSVHRGFPPQAVPPGWGDVAANLATGPAHYLGPEQWNERDEFLAACFRASKEIRTVDPHEKDGSELLHKCQSAIEQAPVIYVLGYGFDADNNRRVGLDPYISNKRRDPKCVFLTNYEGLGTINKRAGKLLFGSQANNAFTRDLYAQGTPENGGYVEMSLRNVYDALAMDFAALEDDFVVGTRI